MSQAADWTTDEVEAVVGDYFEMLLKELAGEPYSKTAHPVSDWRRSFADALTAR